MNDIIYERGGVCNQFRRSWFSSSSVECSTISPDSRCLRILHLTSGKFAWCNVFAAESIPPPLTYLSCSYLMSFTWLMILGLLHTSLFFHAWEWGLENTGMLFRIPWKHSAASSTEKKEKVQWLCTLYHITDSPHNLVLSPAMIPLHLSYEYGYCHTARQHSSFYAGTMLDASVSNYAHNYARIIYTGLAVVPRTPHM